MERKSRSKSRTIVFNLSQFQDKQNILRKARLLNETDKFINEDYCKDTVEYRKELWGEVKLLRSQGKIAYLNYRTIASRDKAPTLSLEDKIVSILLFALFSYNNSEFVFTWKNFVRTVINGRYFAGWLLRSKLAIL